MPEPLRVAYTLEQLWHDVPGGTAAAAVRTLAALLDRDDVEPVAVAGRHRRPPAAGFAVPGDPPVMLPLARPWLYEAWNRFERPAVERATGAIDVCHSTTAIPAATSAPHVVTVHDVAFVHTPERFTGHGARVMRAGLERCRNADLVLCPTNTTADDLRDLGFDDGRVRVVPWGVDRPAAPSEGALAELRARLGLPERFVLFVGTIEPRKNLPELAAAVAGLDEPLPLVVAGAAGWGDVDVTSAADVRFLGFVSDADLAVLYASATVFAYPSLQEGFGMPILEAMAAGVPVVTSRGGATGEVAAGAAVLVDPSDADSIGEGLVRAMDEASEWIAAGLERIEQATWAGTADATVAAYREVVDA